MDEKEKLLDEIQELIDTNSNDQTTINKNYLNYFNLEELYDIKKDLLEKKEVTKKGSSDFLDEIFTKCS